MINLTASFTVRSDRTSEFEAAVAKARPAMLADAGCLRYDLQKVSKRESEYVLLEAYESGEALQRHGQLDAFKELGEALKGLLAAAPVITIMKPVGEQTA